MHPRTRIAAWFLVPVIQAIVTGVLIAPSLAQGRSAVDEPSLAHQKLESLAWLVDHWTFADDDQTLAITGEWADSGNFLLVDFVLESRGGPRERRSIRIAWDPLAESFRSWTFRPDGSFSEGRWTADSGGWKIASTGITADGKQSAEKVSIRLTDTGQFQLGMAGRSVDREELPDLEVTLSNGSTPPAGSMPGLEQINWELYEIRGVPMEFDRGPTVRFEAGNIQAFGGVNRMGGTFELAEGRLKIGPLRATRMAGPPELMELEQTFADTLAAVDGCQIENRELCLTEGAEVIARFREGR